MTVHRAKTISILDSPLPPLQPGQAIRHRKDRTVEKKTKPPKEVHRRQSCAGDDRNRSVRFGPSDQGSSPRDRWNRNTSDSGFDHPAPLRPQLHRGAEAPDRLDPDGTLAHRALPDVATHPDMTALWEATLRKVSDGQAPSTASSTPCRQLGELVARAKIAGPCPQLPGVETRPAGSGLRRRASETGQQERCVLGLLALPGLQIHGERGPNRSAENARPAAARRAQVR